ncbi:MAG: DUF1638 domain-containing protein [Methanomassiliicoccaceae archaeon]|nr:DUF1638 domain-containing protein [Methanomassiliicoccaceae archaeon]
MTKGTIGIIGCPILEDELVYALSNEKEEKRVFVVDTPPSRTLRGKLERRGVPFTVIDQWEFDNGLDGIDRGEGFNIVVIMNKLGLHMEPKSLRQTIEDQLRFYQSRFDAIALYYGSCGNAGWDVSKWASGAIGTPVFVFRDGNEDVCDDCIGVAVGGHSRYCDFVRKHTGMLFVTPAMAGNWGEFSKELDIAKGFDAMGIHNLREVFEFYGYKNAVRIDTGIGISAEEMDRGCEHVADTTGLEFITAAPGTVDLYPAERLYRDAKNALG